MNHQSRRLRGAASYKLGLRAEALCRLALRLKFYRIVATRYKTPQGEIDLIAARGHTLAFVEVKARPDEARAGEAVSPKQQKRLAHAASLFVAQNPHYAAYHLRFDVMQVLPRRWPVHLKNAFFGV